MDYKEEPRNINNRRIEKHKIAESSSKCSSDHIILIVVTSVMLLFFGSFIGAIISGEGFKSYVEYDDYSNGKCEILSVDQYETLCCKKTSCECDVRSLDPGTCESFLRNMTEGFCYDKRCTLSEGTSKKPSIYGSRYCYIECDSCIAFAMMVDRNGKNVSLIEYCSLNDNECIDHNSQKFIVNSTHKCWYKNNEVLWSKPASKDPTQFIIFIVCIVILGIMIVSLFCVFLIAACKG